MQWVLLAVRLALAAVFLVSGVVKLSSLPASRQAAVELGVPRSIAPLTGTVLPFAELATAAALLVTADARPGAVAAVLLLLAFTVLIAANLARGRRPPCRCFGELSSTPISGRTLVRNGVLLVAAGSLVVAGGGRDLLSLL